MYKKYLKEHVKPLIVDTGRHVNIRGNQLRVVRALKVLQQYFYTSLYQTKLVYFVW